MAAPPARTEISDTFPNPSNAVARAGFGKFLDYATGLLGLSGDAVDARTALGVPAADNAALTGDPTATTQASTDNSTRIATTAWAKLGFAVSLTSNGYIKFPTWLGGVIFQWGVCTGGTAVSFPMTYPTGPFALTITAQNAGHAVATYQTLNASGFFPQTWNTAGAATTNFCTWIAVGR